MKTTTYFSLLFFLISFTGCFEIIEQATIKADGSGNFQLVLNCSKSKTKLNSIIKMKTINGHDVPTQNEIKSKLIDIEKTIAKTPGISNVKSSIDFDNYIATISCNFAKPTQLNSIVKNITEKEKTKYNEKSFDYNATTNTFWRLNKLSVKKDYDKMSNADKEIFATANFTAVYKFENTVTSVSNKNAKIAPSNKAVMLQANVLDIITEKKLIENKITLTK
ncbi:MAG: hypothetical protein ABL929_03225 [Ferruginibacter sp.]|nr:hypothetical protein [Ferruginibacter sp.]